MSKKRLLFTKTYKQLASYQTFIANSAGACYPEWGEQKVAGHIFSSRDSVKNHMIGFARNEMDVWELSDEEKTLLGFAKWDDKSDKWLIPVWLFNLLPLGIPIHSPVTGSNDVIEDDTNDDYRLGCVGYCFRKED